MDLCIYIMLLRSNINSAKKSVIMQKRHSHTTFSENVLVIRCFSLNCHFSRKNLMGWPPFTKYYKHTNSPQVTYFIIVNFGLDIFFISLFLLLLRILFLKWLRGLVQGYHFKKISFEFQGVFVLLKVNPLCLYGHNILLFIKFNASKNDWSKYSNNHQMKARSLLFKLPWCLQLFMAELRVFVIGQ